MNVYKYKFKWRCVNVIFFGLIILLIYVLVTSTALADTGNHVSHGDSYDRDITIDGDGLWFLFYLIIEHPFVGIPILIILYVFRKPIIGNLKIKAKNNNNHTYSNRFYNNNLKELKQKDPNFSEPQFIEKVNNMFMQLQNAWTKKDWQSIRPFETDSLWNMHKMQLQQYINKSQTNVVENICILDTKIIKYEQDEVNDIITVMIRSRFNDYVIDDVTGKVIAGNPKEDIYMTYYWKLIRRRGIVTNINNKTNSVTQCPNCGANVSINESGVCEYCDSVISNGQYDWVLSSIESV